MGHADVRRPFWDPCCGTGTLGIEQAMRCLDIAPSKSRRFAFERWTKAPRILSRLITEAREKARDQEQGVKGPDNYFDWNDNAVMLAKESVRNAGLEQFIEVSYARRSRYWFFRRYFTNRIQPALRGTFG